MDGGVYSQFRGVEQGSVGSTDKRRRGAAGIAGVACFDVGEDGGQVARVTAARQLGVAALGADQWRGGDEQLGRSLWRNDGADVAAIEHGAPRLHCKGALDGEQGDADGGVGRDDRGGLSIVAAHQVGVVEKFGIEMLRCPGGSGGVFGCLAGEAHRQAGGTIQLAGIKVR